MRRRNMGPRPFVSAEGWTLLSTHESVGERADEIFSHYDVRNRDGDEVEVIFAPRAVVQRGDGDAVTVIWDGGLEFEGSVKAFAKRYPDLARFLDTV